ncbi:MAG: DNA repair protein RecO [Caldilineaceae bacterium]
MNQQGRVYRTQGVVLSRHDYGEADRILTVFTPELGKQQLIAKGIRKTTSRKAGHLETFTHTSLLVAQARTWPIITEAASLESYRHLRENLDAIGFASTICELVDHFSEADDDNRLLWDLLLLALRVLDQYSYHQSGADQSCPASASCDPNLFLHWFELQLLAITGFQPQFFYCLHCHAEITPVTNYLSLEDGGVFCPRCSTGREAVEAIEPDVLKILRHLQRTPWAELQSLKVRPALQGAVDNLLHRYLLTIVERQLKSVHFLRKLRTQMKPG